MELYDVYWKGLTTSIVKACMAYLINAELRHPIIQGFDYLIITDPAVRSA